LRRISRGSASGRVACAGRWPTIVTELAPLPTPARRKRLRWRYVVVLALCAGAIIWMLVLLSHNVVFFKTVSQAERDKTHDAKRDFRIGGGIVPGSIHQLNSGADFQLTEGGATVTVHHTGSEPELFKDCAPVVANGHWDATDGNTFDSDQILIKHGNDYKAPDTSGTTTVCPKDPFGR
jgi:cytochrome c-type biogenesis protein CcmE